MQNTEFTDTDDSNVNASQNEMQQLRDASSKILVQEVNETPRKANQTTPQTSGPASKRQRIGQLKTVVNELKGIAEIVNTPVEENEFEVFGKNVGLQLKGMPLELALEAQQYVQTYLNKIRLQHLASHRYTNSHSMRSSALPSSSPFSDPRSMNSTLDSDPNTTCDTTPEQQRFFTQQRIHDFKVYSTDNSQDFNVFPEKSPEGATGLPADDDESQHLTQFRLPQNNIILEALTDALHTVNS